MQILTFPELTLVLKDLSFSSNFLYDHFLNHCLRVELLNVSAQNLMAMPCFLGSSPGSVSFY